MDDSTANSNEGQLTELGSTVVQAAEVLNAAREFKAGAIAVSAKEAGVHDPDLPPVDESSDRSLRGALALFKALTVLDGPLPHEQPVIAQMELALTEGDPSEGS